MLLRAYNIPLKEEAGLRQKVGTPERFCKSYPRAEHKLAITGAFCEERRLQEKLIILAPSDRALWFPGSSSLSCQQAHARESDVLLNGVVHALHWLMLRASTKVSGWIQYKRQARSGDLQNKNTREDAHEGR